MVSLSEAFERAKSDGGFYDTWLQTEWDDDKESSWMIQRNLPIIGSFVRFSEARIDNREYKQRHNIEPGDNYHPWRLPGAEKQSEAFASLYRRGVNFVSTNYARLYE